ncbi:hypothetical protein LK994_11645 [Ferruginibacter lapsinanis]|uniref:hypothetical protein n=1 Tax=Ferruginibacter lapsinanis TaxID=563172 RepID=UPI001E54D564|nr:hypothetical protein [Ferruginibacter lapsinanis]UEG49285.1 hypothetical protein LK994_11645 [Ferruginibacter lapsinanis]
MKKKYFGLLLLPFFVIACSSSKTYFTTGIRNAVESNHQPLEKIQFYADRDIILKREMNVGETKVSSGKVKIENGHYVQIIILKKNTPGVCTVVKNNIVGISFENGPNKYLTFGKIKNAKPEDPYRLLITDWVKDMGVVEYEGKKYRIASESADAGIMIKTSVLKKDKTEQRKMKGRTLPN